MIGIKKKGKLNKMMHYIYNNNYLYSKDSLDDILMQRVIYMDYATTTIPQQEMIPWVFLLDNVLNTEFVGVQGCSPGIQTI